MATFVSPNKIRSGGALQDIVNMVEPLGVKLGQPGREEEYVHFILDKQPPRITDKQCRRNVLYLGGPRVKDNGVMRIRKSQMRNADHVVFNSKFFARICFSKYDRYIRKHKIIYTICTLPGDKDRNVVPGPRSLPSDGTINFVTIAKWYKRPFKRLKQTEVLFNRYILPKYPKAILRVIGCGKPNERVGNVVYYQKSFHGSDPVKAFRKSHIQLCLTPFDTGPKTLAESLCYRVPFVCSNNCVGQEFVQKLGKCGKVVKIDPSIKNVRDCNKFQPMTNKSYYGRKLDNDALITAVDEIITNYEEYTSWSWSDELSPETEAKKWTGLLSP
jgi:hypothetical protein